MAGDAFFGHRSFHSNITETNMNLPLSLLLTAVCVYREAAAADAPILDLSLPYEVMDPAPPIAEELIALGDAEPNVNAFVAVECGKIVAEVRSIECVLLCIDACHQECANFKSSCSSFYIIVLRRRQRRQIPLASLEHDKGNVWSRLGNRGHGSPPGCE